MLRKREPKHPLSGLWPDHRLAQELRTVSKILDDNPSILIWFYTICVTAAVPAMGLRGAPRSRCCAQSSSKTGISCPTSSWRFS